MSVSRRMLFILAKTPEQLKEEAGSDTELYEVRTFKLRASSSLEQFTFDVHWKMICKMERWQMTPCLSCDTMRAVVELFI